MQRVLLCIFSCLYIIAIEATTSHSPHTKDPREHRIQRLLREAGHSPQSVDIHITPFTKGVATNPYDYPVQKNGKRGCIEITPETINQLSDRQLKATLSHAQSYISDQYHTRFAYAVGISTTTTGLIASHLPYIRNIPKKHWWITPINVLAHATFGIPAFNQYCEYRAKRFAARHVGSDALVNYTPGHPFQTWTDEVYHRYGRGLYQVTAPCVSSHNAITHYFSQQK